MLPTSAIEIVRRMRPLAIVLALLGFLAPRASAQSEGRWILVPVTTATQTESPLPVVEPLRTALADSGVNVWSAERTSKAFESRVSSPPVSLGEAELAHWEELSDGAVRDLALGENQKALDKLEEAQVISRQSIEALTRDGHRAQKVLDTCLYMVRAILAVGSKIRAADIARECRQLVPRGEPSPYMHPPGVTDLLQQVDAARARQSGALQVRSTPSGCTARLNGVLLGETPVEIEQLFAGRYRLQVECTPDEIGRVHKVTIGAGRTATHVDARFDSVVESRPQLQLRYEGAAEEKAHRLADARQLGRTLSASRLVVVSRESDDVLELLAIEPSPRTKREGLFARGASESNESVLAFARVRWSDGVPTDEQIARAARALADGRCMDFTSSKPVTLSCEDQQPVKTVAKSQPPTDEPSRRRPQGQFAAGTALIGVGIAGLATGYALLIPRASAAEDWYADVDAGGSGVSSQERWLNFRNGIVASSALGSAALVTAMPLALPERDKTPWWAWLSGGAGVGLAAFSIAYGVTADAEPAVPCSDDQPDAAGVSRCVTRGEQTSLAVLTGLTAAPLITIPLVYLLRRPGKAKLEPQAEVGRGRAYVGVRGRF